MRPRFGRIAAAGVSLVVTMVALLGFLGVIPMDGAQDDARVVSSEGATSRAAGTSSAETSTPAESTSRSRVGRTVSQALEEVAATTPDNGMSTALPADTGSGRRVVFSKSAQRVWIVGDDGSVDSTYLVSGSVTNNLAAGSYEVFSRSRWAVGIDDSGVMEYFVRFARGPRAAIGFHSIPTKDGRPLQTIAQLGTPQSHGCIRQRMADAKRMWDFADVGTDVVVVA